MAWGLLSQSAASHFARRRALGPVAIEPAEAGLVAVQSHLAGEEGRMGASDEGAGRKAGDGILRSGFQWDIVRLQLQELKGCVVYYTRLVSGFLTGGMLTKDWWGGKMKVFGLFLNSSTTKTARQCEGGEWYR